MRGADRQTANFSSYLCPEALAQPEFPLRRIRLRVFAAMERRSTAFDVIYAAAGRPSIPPERLLRAVLLQAFFSVRSERQPMDQLADNMVFRWFVGLSMDAPIWDMTAFTKNRDRLLKDNIAGKFLAEVLADPVVMPRSR